MVTQEQVSAATRALALINLFKPWALAFVAVGVAYEFIADRLERPYNKVLETSHNEEMARLRTTTALAQKATAELLQIVAPRDLAVEEQGNIRSAIENVRGRPTVYLRSYPGDGEAARLIILLKNALEPSLDVEDRTGQAGTWTTVTPFFGIRIDPSRNERQLAEILIKALREEGHLAVDSLSDSVLLDSPTEIVVGMKPVALAQTIASIAQQKTHSDGGGPMYDVPNVKSIATPDLSRGLVQRIVLTSDTRINAPKVPSFGVSYTWTMFLDQDRSNTRSWTPLWDQSYNMSNSLGDTPDRTVITFVTDESGQSTVTGSQSFVPIPAQH